MVGVLLYATFCVSHTILKDVHPDSVVIGCTVPCDGGHAIFNNGNGVTRHIAIVVEVLMGLDVITATNRLANPHALGIVSVGYRGRAVGHAGKLSAVFPGVCPCAVVHRVAHVVILDGFAVIGSQQVAPVTVAVGVSDRIYGRAECAGSVGVLFAAEDIAGIVISPDTGESTCLIILPDQLIGRIIDIAGGICAVADGCDVTVAIVGVGVCIIKVVAYILPCGDLVGGLAGLGFRISDIFPNRDVLKVERAPLGQRLFPLLLNRIIISVVHTS